MKKILTAAILALMAVSFSATIVWSGDKVINSDETIGASDQLIIEAGTIVRFGYSVRLIVYGEIKSMGTEPAPVLLTGIGENAWGGIEVSSASGINEFNYTFIQNISTSGGSNPGSLTLQSSTVTVANCRFKNNFSSYGGAIKIISGNVTVQNSTFTYNYASAGGAIYVLNDSDLPSGINIIGCKMDGNDGGMSGGAVCIQDISTSGILDLDIIKCDMFDNYGGNGGALFYANLGKINLEFSKSRMFHNTSDYGSAVYVKFDDMFSTNIPLQKFANLLAYKNVGYYQSGMYFDMGMISNPSNLNFTNATIAFNSIKPSKEVKQDYTSGIYIKSNGNYPQIRNSILWQNTNYIGESNFFIEDVSGPFPGLVFQYYDIGGFFAEQPNISAPPLFVRPPLNSEEEYMLDIDRYDFHLSVHSPCANAGDPAEPCTELNSIRVDMGAYGNTMESVRPFQTVLAQDVNTSVSVPAGEALVIDFQGKAIKANWVELNLPSNSEVYFKASYNADISFQKLITQPGKFDGGIVRIQTLVDTLEGTTTLPQEIVFEENIDLNNANLNDIKLKFQKNTPMTASVTLNNTKFFTKDGTMPYGIEIVEADSINIENSKFLGFDNGAIKVGSTLPVKTKASGRITNNTVSFDGSASQKTKVGKQVGIEVSNANIDIEDNDIDGGDEGIVMKTNSSGRITNNTVSFDGSASQKSGLPKKAIVLSENSVSSEISNNTIFNYDSLNTTYEVTGIEIDNSKADVIGNKMYYGYTDGAYPRIGINLLSPSDTIRIINNTIHGPLTAFRNTPGAFPPTIQIINNIYWSDNSPAVTINDTDTSSVDFMNNCFIDSTYITGTDNIFSDPDFAGDYWDADFCLSSASPCINAGMIVEGIHTGAYESKVIYYYGTAPDIGAEEYYQELAAPSNVTTQITGSDITFGWDAVPGYPYYKVYASSDPSGTFTIADHTSDTSYTASITDKQFFYIVATTEPPTKVYTNEQTAEAADVKNAAPKPERKNFRINRNALKR